MGRKASQGLTELCQRVAAWRKEDGGGRGSRIPDELWDAAVRVARVEGLYDTSQALRFNYQRLRDRIERADGGKCTGGKACIAGNRSIESSDTKASGGSGEASVAKSAGSRFVTVQMGELGVGGRTVIDLAGRYGDRMRLELPGGVDVVGLVETFWRRQL